MFRTFKTISSQHIISKIARTFKPTDSTWIVDAIEDIGWGIQAIGYHANFIEKSTEPPYIKVANHRGKIPCDVERLIHVEMLQIDNTSSNKLNPDGTTPPPEDDEEVCPPKYKGIKMTLSSSTQLSSLGKSSPHTSEVDPANLDTTYQISGDDYIVTQFPEGLIKLYYIGWNTDKDGAPNVVDDFNYKTCLEFYCISQIILRGFKHPEMNYATAFQQYELYRLRASNACKMMGLDQAQRFEASWNRYVRSIDFGSAYYAGLEQQEYVHRS